MHRGEVLVVMVRLLRTLCLRGGAIGEASYLQPITRC